MIAAVGIVVVLVILLAPNGARPAHAPATPPDPVLAHLEAQRKATVDSFRAAGIPVPPFAEIPITERADAFVQFREQFSVMTAAYQEHKAAARASLPPRQGATDADVATAVEDAAATSRASLRAAAKAIGDYRWN